MSLTFMSLLWKDASPTYQGWLLHHWFQDWTSRIPPEAWIQEGRLCSYSTHSFTARTFWKTTCSSCPSTHLEPPRWLAPWAQIPRSKSLSLAYGHSPDHSFTKTVISSKSACPVVRRNIAPSPTGGFTCRKMKQEQVHPFMSWVGFIISWHFIILKISSS